MAQTGTIYGYHDGNTYTLANIYDEKATEINILAGTSAREIVSVSFDTDVGIVYSVDSDLVTQSNIVFYNNSSTVVATTANPNKPATNIIPYLSPENAAEGVALKLNATKKQYLKFFLNSSKFYLVNSSTPQEVPSYAFEGNFYIDASNATSSKTYVSLFNAGSKYTYSTGKTAISLMYTGTCVYTNSTAAIHFNGLSTTLDRTVFVRDLPSSFFDLPFKYRAQYFSLEDNTEIVMASYVNDELYAYIPRETPTTSLLLQYYIENIYIGAAISGDASTQKFSIAKFHPVTVTNFKFEFVDPVYQKISAPANMLIRHNDADNYIPLTTSAANTSAPYIAVRHGNTNFYTIK